MMSTTTKTAIEADPKLPITGSPASSRPQPGKLFRAHTDPALFALWVGPNGPNTRIEHWDARTGGSWRYTARLGGTEYVHGCFHEVRPDRIVQTFTYEVSPTALPWRLVVRGPRRRRSRLRSQSLVDSF